MNVCVAVWIPCSGISVSSVIHRSGSIHIPLRLRSQGFDLEEIVGAIRLNSSSCCKTLSYESILANTCI